MEKRFFRSSFLFLLLIAFASTFIFSETAQAGISLNYSTANVYVGKTLTLRLTGASSTVTWVSGDKAVATVSSTGVVTGKKAGTPPGITDQTTIRQPLQC